MSLPFAVHSLAELDVLGAWEWYEQQQSGLGDRFVAAARAAIVRASRWPNAGTPAIHDDKGDVIDQLPGGEAHLHAREYEISGECLLSPHSDDSGPPQRPEPVVVLDPRRS